MTEPDISSSSLPLDTDFSHEISATIHKRSVEASSFLSGPSPSRENAALALSALFHTTASASSSASASSANLNSDPIASTVSHDDAMAVGVGMISSTSDGNKRIKLYSEKEEVDTGIVQDVGSQEESAPLEVAATLFSNPNKTSSVSGGDSGGRSCKSGNVRKDKSLGTLCESFIQKYDHVLNQRDAKIALGEDYSDLPDLLVSIDAAAAVLGVERRRIYDIINILESLEIVTRCCKNTYQYNGRGEHLTRVLGRLQHKAIALFPDDAVKHGVCSQAEADELCLMAKRQENVDGSTRSNTSTTKEKSLGKLSNRFIQYFLVGNSFVSLAEAATHVLSLQDEKNPIISSKDGQHKTKIRRLYDIANVMSSIGLLRKINDDISSSLCTSTVGTSTSSSSKRQIFAWSWSSLKDIRSEYKSSLTAVTSNSYYADETSQINEPSLLSPDILSATQSQPVACTAEDEQRAVAAAVFNTNVTFNRDFNIFSGAAPTPAFTKHSISMSGNEVTPASPKEKNGRVGSDVDVLPSIVSADGNDGIKI